MNIFCLFGHRWGGCKCERCGTTRDAEHEWKKVPQICKTKCQRCGAGKGAEHEWQGCKCAWCGEKRDAEHDWSGCKCRACGATRDKDHDWLKLEKACVLRCKVCSARKDAEHEWSGCVCGWCGAKRDTDHDWSGCKCSKCAKTRDQDHRWNTFKCDTCGRTPVCHGALAVSDDSSRVAWASRRIQGGYEILITTIDKATTIPIQVRDCYGYYAPKTFFLSNNRLLTVTEETPETPHRATIKLFDSDNGRSLDSLTLRAGLFHDADLYPEMKTLVGEGKNSVVVINIEGDKLLLRKEVEIGQIYSPGPRMSPGGAIFCLHHYKLHRLEQDAFRPIMDGDHAICFTPSGLCLTGGGFNDGSGPSEVRVLSIQDGKVSTIPWGTTVVSDIYYAGGDDVLLCTPRIPRPSTQASVTMLSLKGNKIKWKVPLQEAPDWKDPVLAVCCEHRQFLAHDRNQVHCVSLDTGRILKSVSKGATALPLVCCLPARKAFLMWLRPEPSSPCSGPLEYHSLA